MISLAFRKVRFIFRYGDGETAIPANGIECSIAIRTVQKLIG